MVKITISLFIVLLLSHNLFADIKEDSVTHERPKVGLVLSGGGAKGFAHVGVLKVLERYNIPIDYIGGTSIGAIVGGLYAVGYNADQLENIITSQDWEALFLDVPQRSYMPFYEKDEQGRYLISMQFKNLKLQIPNYAITNNGILNLFCDWTQGYHNISDFDKLPTPFLCITADLLTGNEVVLDKGYLPEAMVASMAIPGVFPSVKTNGCVYVDGGVRNNFPVDQIRAKGADIVIGIDVGAGMQGEEQMEKIGGVVDQLTTMLGSAKFTKNHNDCDIYIKPNIAQFSTADFTKEAADDLLQLGLDAGEANKVLFAELEKQFEPYQFEKRTAYHPIDSASSKQVSSFDIHGSRFSDADVLGIMGISEETNFQCSVEGLSVALERLHGSMKFSNVKYKLIKNKSDNDYTLVLDLKENSQNSINFGAHYTSQDDVSLLFNGTFNTLLLRNSRISFDVKLSDTPALDLRYNINRGLLPGLGIKYGYRSRKMSNYNDGNFVGSSNLQKNYLEINTNSVINQYFTVGLGARYESYDVKQTIGDFPVTNGDYDYLSYRFFFEIDTKDKAYYPTRGVRYYSYTDLITDNGYQLQSEAPEVVSYLSMEQTLPLNHYWTLTPHLYAQVLYTDNSDLPMFYKSYVGGVYQPHDLMSQMPFWGLHWSELSCNNVVTVGLKNRFKFADKHYLYANFNMLAHTPDLKSVSYNKLSFKYGGAIGYSYDSLVGPLEIYFSFSNEHKLRTFVNIGYYF